MRDNSTSALSSLKKALAVLQTFAQETPELGVTELSRLLGVHKSTVSRIVTTLASEGFLEKDGASGKYRLGLKLAELGNRVLRRYDLRDRAAPFLDDLAGQTGEIIHLSVLDKNEIVYLDKRGEGQALTIGTRVGGRNPAHASSMGKVLLADLSPEELKRTLSLGPLMRCTPATLTKVSDLMKELEKVRKQGFATDYEESFPGIRCVAAPIRDHSGRAVAAISITAPKQRMGQERMKELAQRVVETARSISKQLGMTE